MSRLWLVVVAAVSALGCGQLLEADRYRVTSAGDACGPVAVERDGDCVPVGIEDCGSGFSPDQAGGCSPQNPESACDDGLFAPPGVKDCTSIGRLACGGGRFGALGTAVGDVFYVDPQADPDGDGSRQKPLSSIAAALALADGPATLMLASGEYRGSLDLSTRTQSLRLVGKCSSETTIVGDAGQPGIKLAAGSSGSSLESLGVRGGASGIEATDVSGLELVGVWIHDVDGPGIMLDGSANANRAAATTLELVMVQRVVGSGISAYGVELSVDQSVITDVASQSPGSRAIGIDAAASAWFDNGEPETRTPGKLKLRESAIGHTIGAGLRVAESSASVEGSWIHDIEPDALGISRGVDARGSPSQTLPTDVSVVGSVIERAHEAGIQSTGADISLSRVTLRDIGDSGDDACRGAGASLSFPVHFPADEAGRVKLEKSAFERVGRVGLELLGGSVQVDSLLLTADPDSVCASATGVKSDVAAAGGAPQLSLGSTRIDGFANGITAHGSRLTLEADTVTCSKSPIATADAEVQGRVACGCGGDVRWCSLTPLEVANDCTATDTTTCLRMHIGIVTHNTHAVPNASVWLLDYPSVPSALTDEQGVVELRGVPRSRPFAVAASAPGFGPGLAMAAAIEEPEKALSEALLIPLTETTLFNSLVDLPDSRTDTRGTTILAVRACSAKPDGQPLCDPQPHLQLALSPTGPKPVYFGPTNLPDPTLTETVGADISFPRVPTGASRVVVSSPLGKVNCEPNRWGWQTEEPNEFLVYAEPGYTELGAELVCQVTSR